MAPYLNHLGLVAWPFSVVPRPEHCGFLAGRPQLRADVAALLSGLKRRDTSSIHVLWSWFGAGKTHSLYYLAHQAHILNGQSAGQFLYPVYTEFPRDAHGFSDLFRSLVGSFDTELLTGSVLEAATGQAGSDYYERLTVDSPDLASALRNLAIGSPGERSLAMRWLRGEALPAGEFRKIAISQRISTADQAAHVVKALLAMCSIGMRQKGFQGFRLVWLLDEFQRLARTSSSIVRDINSGLHSLFNSCPVGLSMVISFSGRPDAKKLPDWVSPELRDRIGATKVLVLPPFQKGEALQFIQELIAHFRIPGQCPKNPYFPFTKDTCDYIATYVAKKSELRPRALMHVLNAVLEAADPMLEQGQLTAIEPALTERVLLEYADVSDQKSDRDE